MFAALAGTASAASSLNLLAAVKPVLLQIVRTTRVAVYLPATLPANGVKKLYPTATASASGWHLEIGAAPGCNDADACFFADFAAKKGGKPPFAVNTHLANGDAAAFHPMSCGASCAPASLWFVHDGVLYSWQVESVTKEAALIALANAALAAGPRT
jgi:hypothetical protein